MREIAPFFILMNEAKITKLTPEQEAIIPIVKHKWIEIGLDTKPENKEAVIAAINSLYFNLGLQPPGTIEWLDPKTMLRQSTSIDFTYYPKYDVARIANYYNCKIICSIEEAIDRFLGRDTKIDLQDSIINSVNELVHKPLWSSIMWGVMNDVESNFEASISDNDYICLGDGESIFFHFYDYYLCSYLFGKYAYYDYLERINIPLTNIKEWLILAQNSWLWQLYRDEAKVVLRPEINLDKQQKLHNIGKPAVSFESYDLYYYHGQGLSKKYGQLEPKDWQLKWFAISPIHYLKNIFIKETQIEEQELNRKIELEQEKILAKIPVYKARYDLAIYSTTKIDREKVSQAIKAAYSLAQKNNYFAPKGIPHIHFCNSPFAAYQLVKSLVEKEISKDSMMNYITSCLISRVMNHRNPLGRLPSFNLLKDRDTNEKNYDLTAVDFDKNTITTALNSRPWNKIPF